MTGPMRKSHPMMVMFNSSFIDLPTPSKMSAWWKFGSLLGLCLIMQIMTGLFLAMHYTADMSLAFSSISHICRDVNFGWLMRKVHTKSASFFFICLYCHMGRGLYYGSYIKQETWTVGVILFLVTMITAFVGYVLPWGQMSFWAATVMTNLVSAMPYMGNMVVQWIWGGFSMDKATLTRFFTFHFLFPFMMMALAIMHLLFLHQSGSNNPLGVKKEYDMVPFHVYFSTKDLVGFLILMKSILIMSLLFPTALSDPENFMPAKPLVTPTHIQPEWYFLFAYAILRSIPKKLGGVIALVAAVLVWLMVPMFHTSNNQATTFRPLSQILFWILIATFIILTWMGSQPVEEPFMLMGQLSSSLYFLLFMLICPLMAMMENKLKL